MRETDRELTGFLEYRVDLFNEAAVNRLIDHSNLAAEHHHRT
jgi:hypothetical protein